MIDLYTAGTQNGHRAAIALEESGLAYRAHKLNLQAGEQQSAAYLAINPAGVIPAIVDDEGPGGARLTLAQSGAITLYTAEKSGRMLPRDSARRAAALQWFMLACSDCAVTSGTIFQLANHAPEKSQPNVAFFEGRLLAFFTVADARLDGRDFLADEFSIADAALYPVYAVRKAIADQAGNLAHLTRWGEAMAARPAIARGMKVSV